MARVVDVLIPVAVDTAYSYRAPSDLALEPGSFVGAPLGTRHATGVVWAVREAAGDNLKAVSAVRDWPPLKPPLRDFVDWVARWTLAPRGMVLRMAIRAHEVIEPPAPKFGVVATGKLPARLTEMRAKVLAALASDDLGSAPLALTRRPSAATLSPGERGPQRRQPLPPPGEGGPKRRMRGRRAAPRRSPKPPSPSLPVAPRASSTA